MTKNSGHIIQDGAPGRQLSWFITIITIVYDTCNYIWMGCKPTYNWRAPSCRICNRNIKSLISNIPKNDRNSLVGGAISPS